MHAVARDSITLRRRRPTRVQTATLEQAAALSFEPMTLPADAIPSPARFLDQAAAAFDVLRLGIATLDRDPAQLAAVLRIAGDDAPVGLLDEIESARDWFARMERMMTMIQYRAMIATARWATGADADGQTA